MDHFYQYSDNPTPKNLSNTDRFDVVGGWKDIVGNIRLSSFHYDATPAADSIIEPPVRIAAPAIGDHWRWTIEEGMTHPDWDVGSLEEHI